MSDKRPSDSSLEEPVSKKPAITSEEYERMSNLLNEQKLKIAELEHRNTDAQDMTQKQIKKFQERTAFSEERSEMYKNLSLDCNKFGQRLELIKYLNADKNNMLATTTVKYVFTFEEVFIPGKPINKGVYLFNKSRISAFRSTFHKCSICTTEIARYGYKTDTPSFPFMLKASDTENTLVPSNDEYKCDFHNRTINTLCKGCIQSFKLENTTYVEPPKEGGSVIGPVPQPVFGRDAS